MEPAKVILPITVLVALSLSMVGTDARAESWEYSESQPEVLLCMPLPARDVPGGEARIARVLIGMDGYVHETGFEGPAPADSAAVESALRRWIFRPATAPDSNGVVRAIPVWVRIPFANTRGTWCQSRSIGPHSARPDSLLRSRLSSAPAATALRLLPPTSANSDSLRSHRDFVADWFAGSLVAETRVVDPKRHAASLLAAIDLALAEGATDSLAAGCVPEPDYALRFAGTNRTNGTDVFVSLRCDFVQVRSPEATLVVPVKRVRSKLVALEAALFRSATD